MLCRSEFLNSCNGKQIIGTLINLSMNVIELKHTPNIFLANICFSQWELCKEYYWPIKGLADDQSVDLEIILGIDF